MFDEVDLFCRTFQLNRTRRKKRKEVLLKLGCIDCLFSLILNQKQIFIPKVLD